MRGVGRHTVHVKGREKRERDKVVGAEPSSGHGGTVRKKKGARDPFPRSWRESAREDGAAAPRAAGVSERRALRRSSAPVAMAMAAVASPAAAAAALVRVRARQRQGAGRGVDEGMNPNDIRTGLKAGREPSHRPPPPVARCHAASTVRGKAGAGRSAWARGSRARRAGPRRGVMLGYERDAGRGVARAGALGGAGRLGSLGRNGWMPARSTFCLF
jgi:hypothetical protein